MYSTEESVLAVMEKKIIPFFIKGKQNMTLMKMKQLLLTL